MIRGVFTLREIGAEQPFLHFISFTICFGQLNQPVGIKRVGDYCFVKIVMKTFLPCLNLMTTDKMSMASNLEVRVPFLNREMIEMAARMPPRLKLRGLKRKYILKRAFEGVLPKDVIWRRKAGFGAPIRSWLRGPLRPLVADLLSEDVVKRRGLFRPREVKRVIDANFSGREDYNLHVFQLLGLELWHRTFLD